MCAGFEMDLPVTSGEGWGKYEHRVDSPATVFTLSGKVFVSDSGNCVSAKLHMAGYFVSLQVG